MIFKPLFIDFVMEDWKDLVYYGIKTGFAAFFYSLYPTKPIGQENLIKPPAILASNHTSFFDCLFIIAALHHRKPIHFVAKPQKKYDRLYRSTDQIVLGSNDFYRKSKQVLDNERYLCIFCEGKVSQRGELGRFHDGAASIAIRTQTPVIPVYIYGSYDNGRKYPTPFRKVEVRFAKPIQPPKIKGRKSASQLTQLIREEVERLSMLT